MPNWCWNNLEVTPSGDDKDLKHFKSFVGKLLFIIDEAGQPAKDELTGEVFEKRDTFDYLVGKDEDYTEANWYEHNLSRYGTKWDVAPSDFMSQAEDDILDNEFFSAGFQTAWSPPIGFCILLSQLYQVRVEITFDESGDYYAGKGIWENGEQIECWSLPLMEGMYKIDDDWFWNEAQNNYEYWAEEGTSIKEATGEYKAFLTPADYKRLRTEYREAKKEYKESLKTK
ncbi:MAG: hypothetical protein WCL56_11580 [Sediminibacterium sp.]